MESPTSLPAPLPGPPRCVRWARNWTWVSAHKLPPGTVTRSSWPLNNRCFLGRSFLGVRIEIQPLRLPRQERGCTAASTFYRIPLKIILFKVSCLGLGGGQDAARCWEATPAFSSAPLLPDASGQQLVSPGPNTHPSPAEQGLGIWASRSPNLGLLLKQKGFRPSSPPPPQGTPSRPRGLLRLEPPHPAPDQTSLQSSGHHLWLQYCLLPTTLPMRDRYTHRHTHQRWLSSYKDLSNYLKCWHLRICMYNIKSLHGILRSWGANVVHT